MDLLEHLRRQFAYDAWANREVLTAIAAGSGSSSAPALKLLSHILAAERLWLERLRQQPQSLPVWPEFNLDQGKAQIDEVARLWHEYLAQLSPAALSETITYKNSKGEPWSSTVQDVLTHVVLHSAYHRGQIASQMRAAGLTPAYTDFIHAVRQGLIE
ncbi:MAG: DinB family protein [Candidatus Sulfotelmatobacter sp.]